MPYADDPSPSVIAAIVLIGGAGLVLSIVVLAHSGETGYCPKPNPLPPWLVPAAVAACFVAFGATVPERVRCRWDAAARAVQVLSFLGLAMCFLAWTRGGVGASNCGD